MSEVFLGVMDLQEAKNHQYQLKSQGVEVVLKTNAQTCTTGCKVTVEVWGREGDQNALMEFFKNDFRKHLAGHEPNLEHLSAVFDPSEAEVICQACGTGFDPRAGECPDCGLVY